MKLDPSSCFKRSTVPNRVISNVRRPIPRPRHNRRVRVRNVAIYYIITMLYIANQLLKKI